MNNLRELAISRMAFAALLIPLAVPASAAVDLRKDCEAGQVAACTQILQSNPTDFSALANRGIGFRLTGQYDLAVADFDAAVRVNPTTAGLYVERGLAREAKGEHVLAVLDFGRAIGRDPTLVQAHFGRAMAYEAIGQFELSIADINDAMRLNRNMVAALYMQRGYELRAKRQSDEAITAFDRAIEINSDWLLAYFGRGTSFDDKGDSGRAAADYRKCIEFNAKTDLERQRQQEAGERLKKVN